jgi:hypothetical protein
VLLPEKSKIASGLGNVYLHRLRLQSEGMTMNKKLAVFLMLAAFGLTQVAPVAAQTSSSAPAKTAPKKNTTNKKSTTSKKSTAPKKKTTKTTKPKTTSAAKPNAAG